MSFRALEPRNLVTAFIVGGLGEVWLRKIIKGTRSCNNATKVCRLVRGPRNKSCWQHSNRDQCYCRVRAVQGSISVLSWVPGLRPCTSLKGGDIKNRLLRLKRGCEPHSIPIKFKMWRMPPRSWEKLCWTTVTDCSVILFLCLMLCEFWEMFNVNFGRCKVIID